jgi:hypothetical protein
MKPADLLAHFRAVRASRPAYTLFFVSAEETVRVDGDGDGKLVDGPMVVEKLCKGPEQLAESLNTCLDLFKQPPGRKVWVLYEGLQLYTPNLTTAQSTGLDAGILEQALLFELEGVTGLATTHKALGHHWLGEEDGMNQYWVCVAPEGLFDQLAVGFKKRGLKLLGLAHPGGLPVSLGGVPTNWLRLEYWSETLLGLLVGSDGARQVQAFTDGMQTAKLRASVERWKTSLPAGFAEEGLGSGALEVIDWSKANLFRLADPAVLQQWLSAWLEVLVKEESPPLPVIRPRHRPEQEYYIAGGIAAGVLAVCLAHFGWNAYQQGKAESEVAALTKVDANLKALKEGIKKKKEDRDKLKQEVTATSQLDAARVPQIFDALRRRPGELLRVLAQHRTDGLMVEEISAGTDDIMVRGQVLQADEANRLRSALEGHLAGLAWQALSPSKSDLGYFANGGPWQFEIKLKDSGLQGFSKTPAVPAKQGETP